jgi:hypothetical protein
MGGKASVATIYAVFDQPVAQAGQVVTGTVYLSVTQDTLSCVSIGCRIVGQEFTAVTHSDENATSTSVERRRFVDSKFRLRSIQEAVILRGQYGYPFSFTVPANAPISTCAGNSQCCGYVNYTMEVWLDRPGWLRWSFRYKTTFAVASTPVAFDRCPVVIQPRSFDLRFLSLIDCGNVLLGGHAESNVMYAGETITVKFCVVNCSHAHIKAVEIEFTEHLKFKGREHDIHKRKLFRERLSPEQANLSYDTPLFQPDEWEQRAVLRRVADAISFGSTTHGARACTVRIPIPLDAASSYQDGSTFQIRHELQIKLMTTFGTCNASLTQQIYVVNRAPAHVPAEWLKYDKCGPVPQLPPNWSPYIAPMVMIPGIACDLGALRRPEVKEKPGAPVNYMGTARVAPIVATARVAPIVATVGSYDYVQPYVALGKVVPLDLRPVTALAAVQEFTVTTQTAGYAPDPYGDDVSSASSESSIVPVRPKATTPAQLIEAVRDSADPCGELESFLFGGHTVDELQLEELYCLMSSVPLMAAQLRFAQALARGLTNLTCAKVARIAAGTMEGGKGQVVQAMLRTGRLRDRENVRLIRAQLSPAAWAGVERYLC